MFSLFVCLLLLLQLSSWFITWFWWIFGGKKSIMFFILGFYLKLTHTSPLEPQKLGRDKGIRQELILSYRWDKFRSGQAQKTYCKPNKKWLLHIIEMNLFHVMVSSGCVCVWMFYYVVRWQRVRMLEEIADGWISASRPILTCWLFTFISLR